MLQVTEHTLTLASVAANVLRMQSASVEPLITQVVIFRNEYLISKYISRMGIPGLIPYLTFKILFVRKVINMKFRLLGYPNCHMLDKTLSEIFSSRLFSIHMDQVGSFPQLSIFVKPFSNLSSTQYNKFCRISNVMKQSWTKLHQFGYVYISNEIKVWYILQWCT